MVPCTGLWIWLTQVCTMEKAAVRPYWSRHFSWPLLSHLELLKCEQRHHKIICSFYSGFNKFSPENSLVSFWPPPQHTDIFKKASRYKRPSKLKLSKMQWTQTDPVVVIFLSSPHIHLSPFLKTEILALSTSSWSSPPTGKKKVKKKKCIGMSGIVMGVT